MDGTFTAGVPIYEQIARKLEDAILKGLLEAVQQAPSTNELARVYQINPATAAKGLNRLVEEGILYKRRGLGMFVAEGAQEMLRSARRANFYDDYVVGLVREAKRLEISPEELIEMIRTAGRTGPKEKE